MIYIDLTGLCDRKWTGVENYADLLFKLLISKYNNVVGLTLGKDKQSKNLLTLGENKGRFTTEYIYIPKFIKTHKNDIFIFPVFPPSKICWKYSENIIPVIHDIVPWKFKKTMSIAARIILVPRYHKAIKAKKIITVSETSKKELEKYNNKAEFFVIYNCIEINTKKTFNTDIIKKLGLEEKKYLITVSTLEPRKNLTYMLKTIERVFKEITDIKFVVIGRIGWGNLNIDFKDKEKVIFTGYLENDELNYLYKESLAFISLPIDEGFGRTPVEASSFGIPLFVSDIPVFHEILHNSATYVTLENYDKAGQEIAQTIKSKSFIKYDNNIAEQYSLNTLKKNIPDII